MGGKEEGREWGGDFNLPQRGGERNLGYLSA